MSEAKVVYKRAFELEWDADLGRDWMNIFNLELCLYSEEHTHRALLRVRELLGAELPSSLISVSGDSEAWPERFNGSIGS